MNDPFERKLRRFAELSSADRLALSEALQVVRHVPSHQAIVRLGGDVETFHVLLEGWAGHCRLFADGRRQIVALSLPGDCCDPHVPVLLRREHALVALTRVVVACVPGSIFRHLEDSSPALRRAIRIEAAVGLSIQSEAAASLGRRSALERIAHLFCELRVRLAALDLVDGAACAFPLTQEEVSDRLGLSTVHVNRTLTELRGLGLVSLANRRLTINDMPALARLAQFEPGYLHPLCFDDLTGGP